MAIAEIRTIGYMAIRWYQHSTHGGNLRTSLKYKLPSIATRDCAKVIVSALRFIVE
jgi:hypothetical protein